MIFPVDQQASAAVAVYRIKGAIGSRDTQRLLEIIPRDSDSPGNLLCRMYLIGALRAAMVKDFDGFVWAMIQISLHRGYEEFMAKYWIAQGKLQ